MKYKWFYAISRDWHLLKLTAKLIKSIIWDGGFKEMRTKCGHKKSYHTVARYTLQVLLNVQISMRTRIRMKDHA